MCIQKVTGMMFKFSSSNFMLFLTLFQCICISSDVSFVNSRKWINEERISYHLFSRHGCVWGGVKSEFIAHYLREQLGWIKSGIFLFWRIFWDIICLQERDVCEGIPKVTDTELMFLYTSSQRNRFLWDTIWETLNQENSQNGNLFYSFLLLF